MKTAAATGAPSAALQALFDTGFGHFQASRMAEATRAFRQVLTSNPRHRDSLHVLGLIAFQAQKLDEAAALIRQAIDIEPNEASSHSNLGNLLMQQSRLEEAIACYEKAIALNPRFTPALNNLGNALRHLKRLDEAVTAYRRALAQEPGDAETHYNFSMTLLARGDLADGWREHEWRWRTPQMAQAHRGFKQRQWRGEPGEGRTLLIHAEQGLGDTLQFSRYAPMAAARGWRVVLEVPKPLVRLLGSLLGVEQVVGASDPLPAFDLHCPMMSLPLAFGTTLETVPAEIPYLHANPQAVAAWRARLAASGETGKRVGLVWAGNPRRESFLLAAIDQRRSIDPALLAPLFDVPGVTYYSLQKDGPAAPASLPMTDCMPEMTDFADTAALVANLDLVIAVDTAVAHLAASLGKPVWLLDRFDACWRWLTGRRDSPWYPGLVLYRQATPGDWQSVVAEVAADLRLNLL